MRRLAVLLAAVLVAGCGGGGSSAPSPDSPRHAVEAFLAEVKKGDWKAACDLLDANGRAALVPRIGLSYTKDLDIFGQLKDCQGVLGKHADKLRAFVTGADPTSSHPYKDGALVSSTKGDWVTVPAPKPSKNWLVDGLPPPH